MASVTHGLPNESSYLFPLISSQQVSTAAPSSTIPCCPKWLEIGSSLSLSFHFCLLPLQFFGWMICFLLLYYKQDGRCIHVKSMGALLANQLGQSMRNPFTYSLAKVDSLCVHFLFFAVQLIHHMPAVSLDVYYLSTFHSIRIRCDLAQWAHKNKLTCTYSPVQSHIACENGLECVECKSPWNDEWCVCSLYRIKQQ